MLRGPSRPVKILLENLLCCGGPRGELGMQGGTQALLYSRGGAATLQLTTHGRARIVALSWELS